MTEHPVTLMMMNTGTEYWLEGSLVSMKENRSGLAGHLGKLGWTGLLGYLYEKILI